MKKIFRALVFTIIVVFLTCCYVYFNTDPFNEKAFELNTAEYEMLDKGIENIQSILSERQAVYDSLKQISESLEK